MRVGESRSLGTGKLLFERLNCMTDSVSDSAEELDHDSNPSAFKDARTLGLCSMRAMKFRIDA
jgi:hypothetical protein